MFPNPSDLSVQACIPYNINIATFSGLQVGRLDTRHPRVQRGGSTVPRDPYVS